MRHARAIYTAAHAKASAVIEDASRIDMTYGSEKGCSKTFGVVAPCAAVLLLLMTAVHVTHQTVVPKPAADLDVLMRAQEFNYDAKATGLLRNVTAWGYLKTTLMVFRRA